MNNELKSLIILKFGTQSDFAKEMEVDESYVSRVVRGRTALKPKMRDRWAQALGEKAQSILDTEKK